MTRCTLRQCEDLGESPSTQGPSPEGWTFSFLKDLAGQRKSLLNPCAVRSLASIKHSFGKYLPSVQGTRSEATEHKLASVLTEVYVLVAEDSSLTSKEMGNGSWGDEMRERNKAGQAADLAKEDWAQKAALLGWVIREGLSEGNFRAEP